MLAAWIVSYTVLLHRDLTGNSLTNVTLTTDQLKFLNNVTTVRVDVSAFRRADCSNMRRLKAIGRDVCVSDAAPSSDTVRSTASGKSGVVPLLLSIGGAALVVVVAVIVYMKRRAQHVAGKTHQDNDEDDTANGYSEYTSTLSAGKQARGATTIDIWHDEQLLKCRIDIQQLEMRDQIAAGAYGSVWLAEYLGEQVVVKKLRDPHTSRVAIQQFVQEIRFLSQFDHPRIVRFKGVAWTMESDIQAVLECMPKGDLRSYLDDLAPSSAFARTRQQTDWLPRKVQIALDIAEALVYLHSLDPKVVHRDLKSRNVLLNDKLRAKVTDFGISRFQSENMTMTPAVGTGRWIAPEVLRGASDYTEAVDMYSFGVILSELDSHQLPFSDIRQSNGEPLEESALLELLAVGALQPTVSPECPKEVRALLLACLSLDPSERPTGLEVTYKLRQLLAASRRKMKP